jgi:hypothetical protein
MEVHWILLRADDPRADRALSSFLVAVGQESVDLAASFEEFGFKLLGEFNVHPHLRTKDVLVLRISSRGHVRSFRRQGTLILWQP